jgi:hypothetical protein
MTVFRLTGSPKVKSAYRGGPSRPKRRPRPNSDVTNMGISRSFILHLPFCPKATDIIGIVFTGLS